MAKSKSHKRDEDLEGEVRRLKAEVRRLQKQLNYHKKREHLRDEITEDLIEVIEEDKRVRMCKECARGELYDIIIANRQITRCNMCGFRSLAVKLEDKK